LITKGRWKLPTTRGRQERRQERKKKEEEVRAEKLVRIQVAPKRKTVKASLLYLRRDRMTRRKSLVFTRVATARMKTWLRSRPQL